MVVTFVQHQLAGADGAAAVHDVVLVIAGTEHEPDRFLVQRQIGSGDVR